MTKSKVKFTTIRLCTIALLMAMNIAVCSFSIPVPGGHLYLCDIVICTAALLLNPIDAFLVGGLGAFLGDLIFYPVPLVMIVSLFSHGLQALLISLISHHTLKKKPVLAGIIGVIIGSIVMIAGYTFGKAFLYSTPEAALMKLPYETAQAVIGAVFGMILVFRLSLRKIFNNMIGNKED